MLANFSPSSSSGTESLLRLITKWLAFSLHSKPLIMSESALPFTVCMVIFLKVK